MRRPAPRAPRPGRWAPLGADPRHTRVALAVPALALAACAVASPVAAVIGAAAVVVALAPLAREGTARVAAVLLAWLAASQFSYALPWPAWAPPRQAAAWLVVAVGVLAWHGSRAAPAASVRAALPRLGAPEAALAAWAALVGWWYAPWRGDADHLLVRLFLGWDHAGHFAMVEQLRAPSAAVGAPFGGYPRGFHATVASLIELGWGRPGDLSTEIVGYGTGSAAVIAVATVLVAAQAFAAPAFRRLPALLLAAGGALGTLWLQLDDSAQAAYYGFGGFLEAAAVATAAALLPLTWTKDADRRHWLLLGAAAAAILGTWTLLAAFLVPLPLAVYLARRGAGEPRLLVRLARGVPWAVLPVAATLVAQPLPAGVGAAAGSGASDAGLLASVDRFLLLGGAIRTSSLGPLASFAVAGLVLPVALAVVARRRAEPDARRIVALAWASGVALALAGAMLAYEYARVGAPRYYGIKVLCATTLLAGTAGVVAGAALLERLAARAPRWAGWAGSAVLASMLATVAGMPVPTAGYVTSPGGAVRADLASTGPDQRRDLARDVRAACAAIAGRRGAYYLLVPGTTHEFEVRAGLWVISCGLNWDSSQGDDLRRLLPDTRENGAYEIVDIPRDGARILTLAPGSVVIVPAAAEASLRAALLPDQQGRVLTY